ncbi:hypothetical protein TH19_17540 [Thalassospira profundimaris]|uniref:Uncharacterized protein n=1 Tax=Thalassospira profundimaris TaxID=502049 RepID=A0A367W1P5_9PROT|nr:hypothetical protein TH19_17540 [Thalassospira profundimaris]
MVFVVLVFYGKPCGFDRCLQYAAIFGDTAQQQTRSQTFLQTMEPDRVPSSNAPGSIHMS